MSASVSLRGLCKRYGEIDVLRGIDLDIPAGQTVALIGPSGSGKSTLLRLMMALDRPDAGTIAIDGAPLWDSTAARLPRREVRGRVGMVFQHFNLFPHMTALRNVAEAPRHVLGLPRGEAQARAREYLGMVGLADKADAHPAQLSGGQKQRVGIARALAMQPDVMLFDEITSALDPERVGGILQILRELSAARTMTMIVVTHQMAFAERSADRALFFDGGLIVEDAPAAQLFREPREPRTRQFLDAVIGE